MPNQDGWLRAALKRLVPAPLRSLPWRWRWVRATQAYATAPAGAAWKLALWTLRELRGGEIAFATPDGTRFVSMPNNFSSLAVCIDDYRDAEIQRFQRRHLRPGAIFVDVGANIGTYAVRAAQLVGPAGRVIAIEAHPLTFALLQRNLALNGLAQAEAVQVAIGAAEGSIGIVYETRNPGETHVGASRPGEQQVRLSPLDQILAESGISGGVAYLKIDVEGFEYAALEGARQTIAASPAIVVQTELVARHARRYGHAIRDVMALARSLGLRPHRVAPDGALDPIPDDVLECRGDVLWTR